MNCQILIFCYFWQFSQKWSNNFLAPQAAWQWSLTNAELSVVRRHPSTFHLKV